MENKKNEGDKKKENEVINFINNELKVSRIYRYN